LALIVMQAPPVPREALDYLLRLVAADAGDLRDCRARLAMVELDDQRERHLSEKFLAVPDVLDRLRHTVLMAHAEGHAVEGLSCYSSSDRMARLADILGVALLETQPNTLKWGGKAGSRQVFSRAGVPHPAGTYKPVHRASDLATALSDSAAKSGAGLWLVKIDHGFGSGHGNAVVPVADPTRTTVEKALREQLRPVSPEVTRAEFLGHVEVRGAVVEKLVTPADGAQVSFPSVSLHIGPAARDVEQPKITIHGTHDQIVDNDMSFIGAVQPASTNYRNEILRQASLVADELSRLGVRGNVGIDFVVTSPEPTGRRWQAWALEVNLRHTGTTHANRTAALLTGGLCHNGHLTRPDGSPVWYVTRDGIMADAYRNISPAVLVSALAATPGVGFRPDQRHGVVPHLWTTLEPFGKIGAVAIAGSLMECHDLLARFEELLDRLSRNGGRHP
jgi:hypothetical protein